MALGISELARFKALERQVAEQAARIAALETAVFRKAHAESRRADVRQLRQAIANVLASTSERLTVKQVGRALQRVGFTRVPPERTLCRHLAAVRGHGQFPSDHQSPLI